MNRGRRYNQSKPFVSGGVYDGQKQQYQQTRQYQAQNSQPTNNQLQQEATPQQSQIQQQQLQQQQLQQQPKIEREEQPQQPQQDHRLRVEDVDAIMQNNDDGNGEQKSLFKKLFGNRKKSAARTREKKMRQNRRLRKAITPKNALMALHEVKGIEIGEFVANNNQNGGFTVVVSINNNQYEGRGHSKAAAKNNACEKALRDYVIAKMIEKPRLSKANSENSVAPMETDTIENGDGENKETTTNGEDDDVPMINLASFALYKLFSEWESEGFVIPEMHKSAPNGTEANNSTANEPKKPPPIRTELPNNWETMHPSTLLCMMRPGLTYKESGTIGEKPNESHCASVTVDDTEFQGSGRSKKNARRNAAVSACNTLFGTNFAMEGTV